VEGEIFMKTKSILYIFAAMTVLLALAVAPVAAAGNANFMNIVAKDPVTWVPVDGGAWGKMMYKITPKPMFEFNGHGLVTGTEYALISYNEVWGQPNSILGYCTADELGNVHIQGGAMTLISNTYTSGEYSGQTGAKIWLIPSSDLTTTGAMAGWNPTTYLFETSLIPL
jgi:hypothetical protein